MRHDAPVRTLALLCALAVSLSGCVAALIPLAASGVVGRRAIHHRTAAPAAAIAAPAGQPLTARPQSVAAMTPGQVYAGSLPPPPGIAETAAMPARVAAPPAATWSDLLHYVAGRLETDTDSVLIARHTPGVEPHWVPCAGKPEAVIVSTAAAAADKADSHLDALRLLGYALIFTSPQPRVRDPYVAKGSGGAHGFAAGDAFIQMVPGAEGGARARIAARYCVVAIAGRTAADFPDAMVPGAAGAIPGWFAIGDIAGPVTPADTSASPTK